MIPFPSIQQFRNVCGAVGRKARFIGLDADGNELFNPYAVSPTLNFRGTVKLHGTNAAIAFQCGGIAFQSRERVLSETSDNAGFMTHMVTKVEALERLQRSIEDRFVTTPETIVVFGEWCGGNIQKGVAIEGLPKMFVIFAIKADGEWLPELPKFVDPDASIYTIDMAPSYNVEVDFNHPEVAQNQFAALTADVEACCPFGKAFGKEGIGEGIVWRCVEDPTSELWFKVKGEKHSASKVRTLASVDVEAAESMRAFVAQTVTEARLQQGLDNITREKLLPFEMSSIGDFVRWVHADVLKEESDTLAASSLDPKKLGGPIAKAAKGWYVEQLNAAAFA